MRENRQLEFKERVTNTFLKTVCAYANYGTGEILFGVADDGTIVGLDDPTGDSLRIENAINDGISPRPEFTISENVRTGVVTLHVHEGDDKPYLYRSKAYKRSDASTVEVDDLELRRLVLEGSNLTFDAVRSARQDLSFDTLRVALEDEIGISTFGDDTLKTLGLFTPRNGFNNAAALLADKNDFPGIDMARFGSDADTILDREAHSGVSVLRQLDAALTMFDRYYSYEAIEGFRRERHERIPRESFREAIANALAHRTWDVLAHVRVSMFPDRVEVVSPGGLPFGVTVEDYLAGNLSILRNPILGGVLFRLNVIEQFGTGVRRIRRGYAGSDARPRFSVTEGSISVILPVLDAKPTLDRDEEKVLSAFSSGILLSSGQVVALTGFGKDKVLRVLKGLAAKGLVSVQGSGRGTRYAMN
ncbi:MAG: ATP-binding protein [Coriobacteriales bacterium]|nr:ATP-binding protein [Coriobacteriales bacterium]